MQHLVGFTIEIIQCVPLATEPGMAGGTLLRVATIRRTTDTHYRHALQTHTTDTHYRHALQTHTTDTHYRHALQTHTTHTTGTHYRHTLQARTTDTHYRHALQTRTTDTFLFISHKTNVLLFKFRCNIFTGVRTIKEMPGSVASGTPCITMHGTVNVKRNHFFVVPLFDIDVELASYDGRR